MAFYDQQLLNQLQFAVIEPPDDGLTWPSGLWTADEVIGYINQRQNRLLKDTHLQIGIANIPGVAGTIQYDLPDDWINTVRVVWIAANGATKDVIRSNTWEADNGISSWPTTTGVPLIYADVDTPVLTIKVIPAPAANGTIQVHYVPLAVPVDGSGEIMTVPDEFVPAIKYGALADMLSKVSRALDPRAAYCQQRYQLYLEVAKMLLLGWKGR